MKIFFYLIVLLGAFLQTTITFSQTPPSESIPGCNLNWTAPMIDDPNNPGTPISQWGSAGDHRGFVFVVRKDDQHTWDKLLEQKFNDPSLLKMACPTIGVEELGTYSVGITVEDDALNQSTEAWITFNIIAPDTTSLAPIVEICMHGNLMNGSPVKTCQRP